MGYSAAYVQVFIYFYNSVNTEAITNLKVVAWTDCSEFNE